MALAVLPPMGAIVFRLLGSTLRFEDIGATGTHADDHPETRVYCMWHRSLLSIAHHFRKRRIAILISPSFDGELIAAMIHRVGYTPVRGSSSRGGAAGLLGMQRALEATNGTRCNYAAFTSDGPRGPVYHAKPGGVKLAQQVGGGVGIFYAAPDRAWTLKSWDGFLIPKPFSTIVIGWQPPVPSKGHWGRAQRQKGSWKRPGWRWSRRWNALGMKWKNILRASDPMDNRPRPGRHHPLDSSLRSE